jgi:gamma-glutamyltranspeptidase / glutathione hydrolase
VSPPPPPSLTAVPTDSLDAVLWSVPGTAAGWCDALERFGSGRISLAQALAPAIELAEQGFPVRSVHPGIRAGPCQSAVTSCRDVAGG